MTLPLRHDDIIRQQAAEKELDPALIAATIYAESKFRDRERSEAGARGLMQVTPGTALEIAAKSEGTEFVVDDLFDPDINIRYGSFHLRELLDRYGGNEVAALAAYNAGPSHVDEWGGSSLELDGIGFPETRAYVEEVLEQASGVPRQLRGRPRAPLTPTAAVDARYLGSVTDFVLNPAYTATADQPKAISELAEGLGAGERFACLLGATGTGKTFTMAGVIERVQRPALVIAHNKTLAAQLCNEFREFFGDNAVEYFVSYYDYYQPEAYVPAQDLYIEKDSSINDEIDRLRHSATAALLARRDVVIVASVSCIYGIGSPELYREQMQLFKVGEGSSVTSSSGS